MGVKFDNSGTKYVKFATPTNALGNVSKSIFLNYYHVATPSGFGTLWTIFDGTGTDSDEYNFIAVTPSDPLKVRFFAHFSTTGGVWRSTNNVLTEGAENKIMITYNGASVANDPIIYVNGVSVAVTEVQTPVGTYRAGLNTDLYIGTPINGFNPNGYVRDQRIYTGIKTAAQAANIANENIKTNAQIDESGLVFHAPLVMCKGLTYPTYVGSTLSASNEFIDRVNGYLGVPSGSPVGA